MILVALIGANSSPAVAEKSSEGCNVRLMQLKTFSDPQRNLVNLRPKNTTLAAINALPQPHPTPKTRSTTFERQVWRITVQIVKFKAEGDSDIHLILFDGAAYGIAEMPAARCLPKKTRDRKAIIAARKKFTSSCGTPTDRWKELGAVARITRRRLLRHSAHAETARPELRRAAPGHGHQLRCRVAVPR